MITKLAAAIAFFLTFVSIGWAEGLSIGDLIIHNPVARATAPGAKVAAGYLTIENKGLTADRLTGGLAPFAGLVEIHEMKMEDGVMKMKRLKQGLEIPAGATVKLLPGGNHVMFKQLGEALAPGESHKISLTFQRAGKAEIDFTVLSLEETMKLKMKPKMTN